MRYELTARVEGSAHLENNVILAREDFLFEFRRDDEGKLSEIVVGIRVPEKERTKFASTIGPSSQPGVKFEIKVGGDPEVTRRLMTELQAIESLLSFLSHNSVTRIRWDNVSYDTVPENEEDRALVGVFSVGPSKAFPSQKVTLTEDRLRQLVEHVPIFEGLAVHQAFVREGWFHYRHFEYVLAFYKHYFVIEDIFADGKSSKPGVLRAFRASRPFCDICEGALKTMIDSEQHGDRLRALFEKHGCPLDVSGFQELLFLLRGGLHHFSARSTKTKATPFNQEEFQTEALMLGILAGSAVASKLRMIDRQRADELFQSWRYL